MTENENSSILVKSDLISFSTNSPIGYFSKFANDIATSKTRFYKPPAVKQKEARKGDVAEIN